MRLLQLGGNQAANGSYSTAEIQGGWDLTDGLVQNTSVQRSGDGCFGLPSFSSGNPRGSRFAFSNLEVTEVYVRVWIRIATAVDAVTSIISITGASPFYNRYHIKLTTDNKLQLYDGGSQIGSDSGALSTDTWYCVEIHKNGTTVIEARVTEDGESAAAVFATDSSSDNDVARLELGSNLNGESATSGAVYFDDIAVNDGTDNGETNPQDSWPGVVEKIVAWHPDSTGDNDDGTPSTGSDSWAVIDEDAPNDDTDYTDVDGWNSLIDVGMEAPASIGISSGDTITAIAVNVRGCLFEDTGVGGIAPRIKKESAGTVDQAGVNASFVDTDWCTNGMYGEYNYGFSRLIVLEDPDGDDWTYTTLGTAQIGVQAKSSYALRMTSLWAEIGYEPAGGGGGISIPVVMNHLRQQRIA